LKNIIAVIYDFDGTLTPGSMQDYTILPEIGIKGYDFWEELGSEVEKTGGESTLTYLRMLLEKAQKAGVPLTRKMFFRVAKKITYFKGIKTHFDRMNKYVRSRNKHVEVRHYITSGGIKEIIEGTSIYKKFQNVFACEYYYNKQGKAVFPNIVVNDTNKTQYLFRINKGKEVQSESINEHMDESFRPVPFENMIYVGDGLTDVPSMTVVRKSGGRAVAVYAPGDKKGYKVCKKLLEANRADFMAAADYSEGSELNRLMKMLLAGIISDIAFREEVKKQRES
jgi:hypothetical protein